MRLMRWDYQDQHVPGKQQVAAHTLSCAPVSLPKQVDKLPAAEVESSSTMTQQIEKKEIRETQKNRKREYSLVRSYCLLGWASYMPHQPALLRPYWESRSNLKIVDDLFTHDNDGKVIPTRIPLQILDYIHTDHLGLTKCRSRAPISVWWPHKLGI